VFRTRKYIIFGQVDLTAGEDAKSTGLTPLAKPEVQSAPRMSEYDKRFIEQVDIFAQLHRK
jgi:hypothetical protein